MLRFTYTYINARQLPKPEVQTRKIVIVIKESILDSALEFGHRSLMLTLAALQARRGTKRNKKKNKIDKAAKQEKNAIHLSNTHDARRHKCKSLTPPNHPPPDTHTHTHTKGKHDVRRQNSVKKNGEKQRRAEKGNGARKKRPHNKGWEKIREWQGGLRCPELRQKTNDKEDLKIKQRIREVTQ